MGASVALATAAFLRGLRVLVHCWGFVVFGQGEAAPKVQAHLTPEFDTCLRQKADKHRVYCPIFFV